MNTKTEADSHAVAGQVERRVRPRVWVRRNGGFDSGVAHYGSECPPGWTLAAEPMYDQAALDAARMAGVHSAHEQTAVVVRAALELLESIEGNEPFTAEKMRAFLRVFGA